MMPLNIVVVLIRILLFPCLIIVSIIFIVYIECDLFLFSLFFFFCLLLFLIYLWCGICLIVRFSFFSFFLLFLLLMSKIWCLYSWWCHIIYCLLKYFSIYVINVLSTRICLNSIVGMIRISKYIYACWKSVTY